jgi:hypothetical protein
MFGVGTSVGHGSTISVRSSPEELFLTPLRTSFSLRFSLFLQKSAKSAHPLKRRSDQVGVSRRVVAGSRQFPTCKTGAWRTLGHCRSKGIFNLTITIAVVSSDFVMGQAEAPGKDKGACRESIDHPPSPAFSPRFSCHDCDLSEFRIAGGWNELLQ